jgi:hypothetical protein
MTASGIRVLVATVLTVAPAANAQQMLRIRENAGPNQWHIQLTRTARLEVPRTSRPFAFPTWVLRDRHGSYYVLDQLGPTPVRVFDSAGRLLRELPREHALIAMSTVRALALTPPDTLHVISGGDAVFDRSGKLVRKHYIPREATVFRALGLPTGTIVLQAIIRTSELFGYPFHLINADGVLDRSFGAARGAAFDGNPSRVLGTLAVAGRNRFWTSDQRQYRISLWTTDGTLVKALERDADWFRPWNSWNGRMDAAPPPPRLLSTWQDSRGRLLTLSAVAAADWKPIPGRSLKGEAPAPTAAEFDDANDSVLEIIDPNRGVVLASQRFPNALVAFVSDSLVAGRSVDPSNRIAIDIWSISLSPKRR